MTYIGAMFSAVVRLFQVELTIYGFTFSFWEVFVFAFVVGFLCWLIREVFLGE